MIHIIYSYLIITGVFFGYCIGDDFNHDHILIKLLKTTFWLLILLFEVLKYFLLKIWEKDFVKFGLVHLGFNVLKGNENTKYILDEVDKNFVPIWKTWLMGNYFISGLNKLKKMNSKQNDNK